MQCPGFIPPPPPHFFFSWLFFAVRLYNGPLCPFFQWRSFERECFAISICIKMPVFISPKVQTWNVNIFFTRSINMDGHYKNTTRGVAFEILGPLFMCVSIIISANLNIDFTILVLISANFKLQFHDKPRCCVQSCNSSAMSALL